MIVPTSTVAAVCALLVTLSGAVHGQHQQQIDPSYLQQYYAQVAQAAGAQADATPIVEQTPAADAQQQYYVSPQAQQIRVKDAVAQQVRAQQQQQQQYVAPSVRQYLQQPQPKPQQPQHAQYLQQPQQQIHYRPAPAPAPKQTLAVAAQRPRVQPTYQQEEDERLSKEGEEEYEQNPSYQFGFDVKDDEFTNYQNRKESRDGNVIKGSYSVVDSDGFIRTVTYTADPKEGFKAQVVREPTDIVVKVPTQAPPAASIGLRAGQQHQQHQHQPQQQQQQQQPQHQQQHAPQQQQQYYQPQQQYRAPQKQHQQQAAPQPQYQYE